MKIINAGYEFFDFTDNDVLKRIERAGRVCYKSEDKIDTDSATKFCANIIKRGHEAVLEHGSFCFEMDLHIFIDLVGDLQELELKGFNSFLRTTDCERYLVSANVRAWRDFLTAYKKHFNHIPGYMKEFLNNNVTLFPEFQNENIFSDAFGSFTLINTDTLTDPIERLTHHSVTVLFVCDRGISHEIVRHRPASYCQESTRYCNYSKDKFGNEITVIKPCFWNKDSEDNCERVKYNIWENSMKEAEKAYFNLIELGATPQEARSVLPTELKTEVVMTATIGEWLHFFTLRTSDAAHPQIRELAIPLSAEFVNRNLVLNCYKEV